MNFEYLMKCKAVEYYQEKQSKGFYVQIGKNLYPVPNLEVPEVVLAYARKRDADLQRWADMLNLELSE